jgi:hypothetical protein
MALPAGIGRVVVHVAARQKMLNAAPPRRTPRSQHNIDRRSREYRMPAEVPMEYPKCTRLGLRAARFRSCIFTGARLS